MKRNDVRTLTLSLIFCLFFVQLHAQISLVKGLGLQFGQTSLTNYQMVDTTDNVVDLERKKRETFFAAINYTVRTNLYTINNNNSIAIDLRPTLGFYFSNTKELNDRKLIYNEPMLNPRVLFQLPILLEYNLGVLSTVDSDLDHGLGVGFGINYQRIFDAEHYNPDYFSFDKHQLYTGPHNMWQPTISLAYRRWGSNSFCYEYAVKYMFANEEFRANSFDRNTILFNVNAYINY